MYQYPIKVGNTETTVYRFPYEPVDSNMFFIPSGKTGIVFDPNENNELLWLFKQHKTKQIAIVLTHEHFDHTNGVVWLQSNIRSELFCQKDCAKIIATERGNAPRLVSFVLAVRDAEDGGHRYEDLKQKYKKYILIADKTFEKECTFEVESLQLRCYSKPGHSPGSAMFILGEEYVFTGDLLIQNTPTILRFPDSNKSLYENETIPFLKSLGKNMIVFPGHGDPFKIKDAKFL